MGKRLLNESGQALVLVLLSLAVVLTLVLFILSRTVTDIAVSSREEEAIRAFSAAEAGIENVLVAGSASQGTVGDATFNAQVSGFAEGTRVFNYPIRLNAGESSTLWFVAHDDNSNIVCSADKPCFTGSTLAVCWGNPGTPEDVATTPALELSIFYTTTPNDLTTLRIGRIALDPNSGRRAVNSFASPDSGACAIEGEEYGFGKAILLSDLGVPASSSTTQGILQFARARMIYNSDATQKVGFSVNIGGNSLLPSQGKSIDSTGVSGDANRRVNVFQSWPEVPSIFENAIFSAGDIVK